VNTNAPSLLTGRLVTRDAVVPAGAVVVDDGRIVFAGKASELPQQWSSVQPPLGWTGRHTLLPGLVDAHTHGGAGGEFGPDPASARLAVDHHHRSGTTSLLGSLVSNRGDALIGGVVTCAAMVATGDLAGIHLEGPFLSMERRGAQNPAALCDVDTGLLEALVEAAAGAGAPGSIAQMTFAPERPGATGLPGVLGTHAILGAIGHTDCDAETAWSALRASRDAAPRGGRPLVTHVFNGMPPLHHRTPGPVSACLAAAGRGEAVLEVVGDGVHLAPATVRMLFDLIGAQGICLVTDAMAASGMPDGTYTLGGQDVVVSGRTARLVEGNAIAGGVATLLDVVRWCVESAGIPLLDAVRAASSTPSQTLGLGGIGSLAPGNLADVVVVDDDLSLHAVMRRGQWLLAGA
jgi:N-acetylglucosamine-6-phosphate deacetylase